MNSTDTRSAAFLARLRESTSPLHLALEQNAILSSLTNAELTISKYQVYLSMMIRVAGFYEAEIQQKAAALLNGWKPRNSSGLLENDLEIVEEISGEKKINAPEFHLASNNFSPFSALGFMYVMEGSKLGGRVIFKQVKRYIGLDENRGAKYLADFGSDTLESWKLFLQSFSSAVVKDNGEKQSILGANLAFSSIAEFFASNKNLYAF